MHTRFWILKSVKIWEVERKSQKFHSTFTISSGRRWANEFLIESLLKEGLNPWFRPSLRDFMDNYKYVHISILIMVSNLPTLQIVGFGGGGGGKNWGLMLSLDSILVCNNPLELSCRGFLILKSKACRCYLVTSLNRTPMFDWCVLRWGSNNKHHKTLV